jgi:glycosyltransferase involved in cell wall biosynthesis
MSFLKRLIPRALRPYFLLALGPLLCLPRLIAIWCSGPPVKGAICVFYGQSVIPSPDQQASGGIVKFQWMQQTFPNIPDRFNIVYMVSSQMPLGAAQIAACSKRRGARLVWNQNGVAYPGWHGSGWRVRNTLMAELLHAADHVFYQSQFCKLMADRYLGVRGGLWEILYNAVDTTILIPAHVEPDPRRLVLLLGGNQYQYYRLESALLTLAVLVDQGRDVQLLVTGRLGWTGTEAEASRDAYHAVHRAGLTDRVMFLGPYTQSEAPAIFQKAHILLHTKYNDPSPGVVVEAMSCGLPVVYSASGGVPELVGKDAGVGISAELCWDRDVPPDPHALAKGVLEVAEKRQLYAQAARQRAVEMFDLKPWLRRHRQIFEELLQ